jgi:conjugative transposon TraN protein
MKNFILTLLLSLCGAFSAWAQEAPETKILPKNQVIAPFKIEVTFSKTTHILFPSEVKYIDLGSHSILAGKASGVGNVVRVKAAIRDFEEETNFSVITSDGSFYTFNAVYSDAPVQLSIEMTDWLREGSGKEFANDRMFVQLTELGEEMPIIVNKIMYNIYKKNRSDVKHLGCKKFGIQALLKGIYVHGNLLYFHTSLRNNSNIAYDIDFFRFKIVDKKIVKRTAIQETIIKPVRTYNELRSVTGKSTARHIFAFEKMTIPDDKVLVVEIYERNGGRHQSFVVENTDIVDARLISELKLK